MKFESMYLEEENHQSYSILIEQGFEDRLPSDFLSDPFAYVAQHGVQVKEGEPTIDDNQVVREDPTAVLDLPLGDTQVVVKRVNSQKGEIKKRDNVYHEYEVMLEVIKRGLKTAQPIAYIDGGTQQMFLMEALPGTRWIKQTKRLLKKEHGYSDEDLAFISYQIQEKATEMEKIYAEQGVFRNRWKEQDMIIDLDVERKRVLGITPIDWERGWIGEKAV